jgi:type I restriction enzyme S subunit
MSMQKKRLSEVAHLIRGVTFDKSQQQDIATEANIPVLRAGNIGNTLDTINDLIYVPKEIVSDIQLMQLGDIAICLSSGSPLVVGKSAALGREWKGTVGAFCGIVRPKEIEPEFLTLWLRGTVFLNWRDEQARGANIQNLRFSELGDLAITLPPIEKQRQIAALLKAQLAEVEKARQAAETQKVDIYHLQNNLLKIIFSKLKNIKKVRIGEVATTTSGSTPSRDRKDYWDPPEVPWIKTAEVNFAPIFKSSECVSRKALSACSLTLLPPKTVLIAMYGQGKTREQSAILEMESTTNQACFAILPNDTWDPEYLYLWLRNYYLDLRELSEDRGGNQANLNGALLKAINVPAPIKEIQKEIILKANAAIAETKQLYESIQVSINDIEKLKRSLLSQAFEM